MAAPPFRAPGRFGLVPTAFAALAAAASLSACAPSANRGPSAVADGVKFDYALAQPAAAGAPHTYRLSVKIADAATGSAIDDANVAVNVYGPGYDGSDLVNLKRDGEAYAGEVVMPKAAAYRLTFQVNRKAPAASAVAVFETQPPA
jgi:hypothetical protein